MTTSWATIESLIHGSNLSPAVEKEGVSSDQLLGNIGPENGVQAFRFRSYACTYLSEVLKEPGSVKGRKPHLSGILSGKISCVSERNASVSTLRMCMYVSMFGVGAMAWVATSGCWKAFLEGWVWFSCRILILLSGVANMWRRQWHPTPVLLPGKSHGRRSLVGCSPWGHQESDTTERLHFHFSLSCIGEGNGNPLQCSCLQNPRDRGAWWAAVYGVAQSRTQLKRLSSSSSSSQYEARAELLFILDRRLSTAIILYLQGGISLFSLLRLNNERKPVWLSDFKLAACLWIQLCLWDLNFMPEGYSQCVSVAS